MEKAVSSTVQGRHSEGSFKVAITEEEGRRRRDGELWHSVLEGKQMIRECILRNNGGSALGSSLVVSFGEWVCSRRTELWDTSRSGDYQAGELQETDDPNGKAPDNR